MALIPGLEMVACSDPGVVRSQNEDAVFADAQFGVAILADGMGGYNAGEVASGMATTLLARGLVRIVTEAQQQEGGGRFDAAEIERYIVNEVEATNFSIFHEAQSESRYGGMGTTLVLAWFYDKRLSVGHVGDSRLYRLRGKSFEQLTRDHSLIQQQLDAGMITPEEARYSGNRNLVTRAIGVDPMVEVEIHDYDVIPGDIVLLCSDGLSDMVDDHDIEFSLRQYRGNLQQAADHLVLMANDNGGRDNISVILVKVLGENGAPRHWWQRTLARLK